LHPRIVRVEVQAAERLPTAMVTAFDVAARAMAFADGRTAVRAWSELPAHAFLRDLPTVGKSPLSGATAAGSAPVCVAPAADANASANSARSALAGVDRQRER
jgi:hypothetical protein